MHKMMSDHWKSYWATAPAGYNEHEYLRQVGKTVKGVPISEDQFALLVNDILNGLELTRQDRVLDMCCGNGLITNELASRCSAVAGVDYSEPLLAVARRNHQPANVQYFLGSALRLNSLLPSGITPFSKVLMYEALQHFEWGDFVKLLQGLSPYITPNAVIYFGSIPDQNRKWHFYNTWPRRLDYFRRRLRGREAIGTWWKRSEILRYCDQFEMVCEFIEQSSGLHTAHYRFDVQIRRVRT